MLDILLSISIVSLLIGVAGVYLSEIKLNGVRFKGLAPLFFVVLASFIGIATTSFETLMIGIPLLVLAHYLIIAKTNKLLPISWPSLRKIPTTKWAWYLGTLLLVVFVRVLIQIDWKAGDFLFSFHDSYYYSMIMNSMHNHGGEYSGYQSDSFLATGEGKHTLYHFVELWIGGFISRFSAISFAQANDLIVHPVLLWMCFTFIFDLLIQKGQSHWKAGAVGLVIMFLPGILFIDNFVGERLHLDALTIPVPYHNLSFVGSNKNVLTFLIGLYSFHALIEEKYQESLFLLALAPFLNASILPIAGCLVLYIWFKSSTRMIFTAGVYFLPFITSAALILGSNAISGPTGNSNQQQGILHDFLTLIKGHLAEGTLPQFAFQLIEEFVFNAGNQLFPLVIVLSPLLLATKTPRLLLLGLVLLVVSPFAGHSATAMVVVTVSALVTLAVMTTQIRRYSWIGESLWLLLSGGIIYLLYKLLLYNVFDSRQIYLLGYFLTIKAYIVVRLVSKKQTILWVSLIPISGLVAFELAKFWPLEAKKWQARSAYARADIKSIALSLPRFTKIGTLESIKDPKYLYNEQQWYPFVHYNDAISFHAVGTNQVDAKTFQAIVANKTTSVLDNIPINHFSKNHPGLSSDQATIEFMRTYGFSYLSAEDTLLERHHTYLKPYLGKILAKGTRDGNGFTFYELKPW